MIWLLIIDSRSSSAIWTSTGVAAVHNSNANTTNDRPALHWRRRSSVVAPIRDANMSTRPQGCAQNSTTRVVVEPANIKPLVLEAALEKRSRFQQMDYKFDGRLFLRPKEGTSWNQKVQQCVVQKGNDHAKQKSKIQALQKGIPRNFDTSDTSGSNFGDYKLSAKRQP